MRINKLSFLMLLLLLSFCVNVNADEIGTTSSSDVEISTTMYTQTGSATMNKKAEIKANKEESKVMLGTKKEEMKAMMESKKEEIKKARFEIKEFTSLNRTEQKKNLETFRVENKTEVKNTIKALDLNTKDAFKELSKEKKAKLDEIIAKIKSKDTSFEEKETFRKQLEELRVEYYTEVRTLLASNSGALDLIVEREAVFEKDKELREQNSLKRQEFAEKIKEKVASYKEVFIAKVGDKIENISNDKLPKLLEQIEKMQARYENNTKKESLISQLEALKQIINDKLSLSDISEEINLGTTIN